jgi:hypothetical protein
MKDVILKFPAKAIYTQKKRETCISILAGYMGIKGIYNSPPNLPKQKKNHNSTPTIFRRLSPLQK